MEQAPESPVVKVLEPQKTSWVALGGLIVVLLAVAGGVYYLSTTVPSTESIEAQVEGLEAQSDSTEPEAIEADLAAQSPEQFEKDFDAAFEELDASLAE